MKMIMKDIQDFKQTNIPKDIVYLAVSKNGIDWQRKDDQAGLYKSVIGWDSEMLCYPVEINTKYGRYIFYSGNGMGLTGVGFAKFINE